LLIYFNINKKPNTVYIGLFFFFLSAYNYFQYVIIYSESIFLIGIVFIHLAFVGYIIGPVLYFYVRSSISGSSSFRKTDLIHFIPLVLYLIASTRYFLLPWETKTGIASQIIQNKDEFWHLSGVYLNRFIPKHINYFGRPMLLALYVLYSFYMLLHIKKSASKKIAARVSYLNYRWLLILLTFTLLLSISQAIMVIISIQNKNLETYYSINIFQILSSIGLIGIIIIPFFYPSVLYGLARFDAPATLSDRIKKLVNDDKNECDVAETHKGKNHPDFEIDYIKFIENTIVKSMEADKPYLQKDCNLNYFAKILGIPTHHLYFYFREITKQPFNDFRNEWRIKHAKDLIEKNKNRVYTIEAIGLLSGFSSKNAFFSSFKKHEGITPGNYALQNQEQSAQS
jgi:AraC-like DNA-binding protein